jgi:dTDP-L-rhamnose 4-epimerase
VNVLITGGAGFIGLNLSRKLLSLGHKVSILDSFSPQIHGTSRELPAELKNEVELFPGDVRDAGMVRRALNGVETVVHLAAETGTGQSMYEITRYADVNIQGTAVLFDAIINTSDSNVSKIVLASSRAVYGEGKYSCVTHAHVYPGERTTQAMLAGQYEPKCPLCAEVCRSVATDEASTIHPTSFYGLTKQVQEQMVLLLSRTNGISASVLRYQNVYGPGQSLRNPYTGILAIFSSLARTGAPICLFEDGLSTRDFVFIDDVVDATIRSFDYGLGGPDIFNVGSGEGTTIFEIARGVSSYFGNLSELEITGLFRTGDIRHNAADLTRSREILGFEPKTRLTEGLIKFLNWAASEVCDSQNYLSSFDEMRARGLMHG